MSLDLYLVREFLARCQDTFNTTILHKELFDRNPDNSWMRKEHYYDVFGMINHITQEHSLLQIAKLHDPALQKGRHNLSIDYIITQGNWSEDILTELKNLQKEMNELYKKIMPARHRAISHHDIESIMNHEVLGSFEKDEDEPYFAALEKFASLVSFHTLNKPFHFNTVPKEMIIKFREMNK